MQNLIVNNLDTVSETFEKFVLTMDDIKIRVSEEYGNLQFLISGDAFSIMPGSPNSMGLKF